MRESVRDRERLEHIVEDIAQSYGVKWIPSMVVVGPDGEVKLSTVLTYKVDKYLKELTTGKYAGPGKGESIFIDGDHGRLKAIIQKPELQQGDRVVPYTYGERFHQIWPKSELVIQEYFDHGFSQNIYRSTDIVSDYLIKQLK